MMKINEMGLALITKYEGLKLDAYLCPAGIPTVGYGHTGSDVKLGMKITFEQAIDLLKHDLEKFEAGVISLVTTDINSNQFSALVCFAYNCGLSALSKSTLLKYLNHRQFGKAADEFPKWNKARNMILPGLTRRRLSERDLFLS